MKYLELEARDQASGPFDSKISGIPYLPQGFEYPKSKSTKKPLFFLAQINFGEFPKLEGFPEDGILQFYVNADDDVLGCNFDDETNQAEFRVILHEHITSNEELLQQPPETTDPEDFFALQIHELKLLASIKEQFMSIQDFRFNQTLKDLLGDEAPNPKSDEYDLLIESLHRMQKTNSHRIGWNPYFTQDDPRLYQKTMKGHTILLLQITSLDGIMIGDCGLVNFFITPKDLAKKDFSRVAFNWDCS
ncbi:MAG: hypothetical protein EZS28_013220 [Streblomastix strix]|uniref:DUF1963 domain-containing protein n=1 Tax=Streblomastix strix TaxID=222440 RepID=A0A5J4W982_9EUKA|nr:MAG: hypothetical protein EZS28_013220 [Streblomastix strix]